MKVLVDTNIFIYAVDQDSKFHDGAYQLLTDTKIDFYTTSKNITEFLVVLTRDTDIGLSAKKCFEILNEIIVDFKILYPNYISMAIFGKLIQKYNPIGLWIHDIEIASMAIAHNCPTIATKNIKDFGRIEEVQIKII